MADPRVTWNLGQLLRSIRVHGGVLQKANGIQVLNNACKSRSLFNSTAVHQATGHRGLQTIANQSQASVLASPVTTPAAAAPAAVAQQQQQQQQRRGRWARALAQGAAAAGLLAASCSALMVPALADASAPPQGGNGIFEALAATQLLLAQKWQEIEEDMHRINARLPARAPPLAGVPPKASAVGGGKALEVVIPVRAGADVEAIVSELMATFGTGAQTQVKSHTYGTSREVLLEVVPDASQPSVHLRASLFVPLAGGREQAELVVLKQGGQGFTRQELEGLGKLVKTANLTFDPTGGSAGAPARGGSSSMRTWSSSSSNSSSRNGNGLPGQQPPDLDEFIREIEREFTGGVLGPFMGGMFGGLRDVFDEMQRAMEEEQQRYAAEGDGDDRGRQHVFVIPPRYGGDDAGAASGTRRQPGGEPAAAQQQQQGQFVVNGHDWGNAKAAQAVKQLTSMGAQVSPPGQKDKTDWGILAGYDDQKRTIEDCLLYPLLRPEVYSRLAQSTRAQYASNRPRAVLFEGPPGTGKTTSARIISSQAAVPLVYVPLESVLSKWYGESEGLLAKVFKAAEALGGAIIFIDELDSLGGSRDREMHEASRRMLSVLLREMEGFDAAGKRAVVIGATNRKNDLDAALLSRFDLAITFGVPDERCRALILAQYAKQLSRAELAELARRTPGMAGRDLRDVCEHTERRWASKIVRGEVPEDALPPVSEYLLSTAERMAALHDNGAYAGIPGASRSTTL